ncbi:SMP-30/gluconolactonase/LRE family protein [Alsobacter sp. SYSU BS001988]
MADPIIECVLEHRCLLGESPVWAANEGDLYWVDIHKPSILRWNPSSSAVEQWPMPENIGSIGLSPDGLVAALRLGFATLTLPAAAITRGPSPIAGRADLRFNDGRVDRRGRFWAGTVSEKREPGLASLYRFDRRGVVEMATGFTVSNGICWSPDNRVMYFADSWTRTIYAYDFDIEDGELGERRVFATFKENEGIPDGATVDIDGCYWITHFDGGRLSRYTPDGRLDRSITMPVPRPTSCAFVGPRLDTLLVTSASFNLSAEQIAAAPLSGCIFAINVGTQGLPDPVFAAS